MSLSSTEQKAESHSCLDRNPRSPCNADSYREAGPKPDLGLVHHLFLGSVLSAARCPIHEPRLAVTEKYLPWTSPSHSAPSPEGTGHFFLSLRLLELKRSPSPLLSVHHHVLNVELHWCVSLFFSLWLMLPRIEVILFSLFSGSPGLSSGIPEMPARMDRSSLSLTISHHEDGNSHRSSLIDKHQQGLPPYNMLITTKTRLERVTQSLKIGYKWTTYGRQDFALGLSDEHSCYLHK